MQTTNTYTFSVNKQSYTLELPADIPLLWVLRDYIKLPGTKYGCGIGACGACMVLVSDQLTQSCLITAEQFKDKNITTIEGLANDSLHKVQQAWLDNGVVQCGYCQSGQIMAAVSLMNLKTPPDHLQIKSVMSKVLCRCGTYPRINKALVNLLESDESNANE